MLQKVRPHILFIIILVGCGLSIVTFILLNKLEFKSATNEIARFLDSQVSILKQELEFHIEILYSIRDLYYASEFVSRDEFNIFTQSAYRRHPTIQALEWVPKVPHAQRQEYVRQAHADQLENFQFTELDTEGNLVTAQTREFYYPVLYAEPLQSNLPALGFDLASNASRLKTLRAAIESGTPQATEKINLVQGQGIESGLLIILPIYKTRALPATIQQRNAQLQGFIIGVFKINHLLERSLQELFKKKLPINIQLLDITASDPEKNLLYENTIHDEHITHGAYFNSFTIANRNWKITATPSKQYLLQQASIIPSFFLVLGLSFTILLSIYISKRLQDLLNIKKHSDIIINSIVNGIITIDAKGIIETFNYAAQSMFSYSEDEILGHPITILFTKYKLTLKNSFQEQIENNSIIIDQAIQLEGIDRIGNKFPIEVFFNRIQFGKAIKYVGVLTDITERKQAEIMIIKAKEKAEESNRLKTEFLNTISHELRTPLTIMLGNLPLLTNPNAIEDKQESAEIAQDIERSGKHLLNLINDLLDLSKIEAGKMLLQKEWFQLEDFLADIISEMQPLAENKGIQLQTDLTPLSIFADKIRFKQILFNLIGNAIKFTTEGEIKVATTQQAEQVTFIITDTGCGIDKQSIEFIFDRFRQADGSYRRVGGSGLGLAITKKLIELHGGNITVQSIVGEGSTFSFTISTNISDKRS